VGRSLAWAPRHGRAATGSRGDLAATAATPVDFRRPSRIGRDAVMAVESTHEAFTRRLLTLWGASTHTALEITHLATEQLSVDDYVRTLPSPTVLATLRAGPLGATALLDLDLPLALLLVERLLGGVGDPATSAVARRPTDLETSLISHDLLEPVAQAIDETLRDLDGEPSELLGVETSPQRLQMASSGELLLLLTYRIEIRGDLQAQGLLSLAYPVVPLMAQLDRIMTGGEGEDEELATASAQMVTASLMDADLGVRVRLGESPLPAAVLAGLVPGDVLRLDHSVHAPARLVIDDREVGTAHLGRRGRRLAVQIQKPPTTPRPLTPVPAAESVVTNPDAARVWAEAAASSVAPEGMPADRAPVA
jgi:flagellar motor switch protein FliM